MVGVLRARGIAIDEEIFSEIIAELLLFEKPDMQCQSNLIKFMGTFPFFCSHSY
jgi:hypothetical protein